MKETDKVTLEANKRWLSWWERVAAKGNPELVFNDLVTRYREPHRFYHTIDHIGDCLDKFEEVRRLTLEPDAIELAIWYHDVVYDPHVKDNEEKSAALASEMIEKASLPGEFRQAVANLTMATKHTSVSSDFDTQILTDIDLSILGETEDKFGEYEKQIRKEYNVSEEAYRLGRTEILKSFLGRRNIYSTQFFHDRYGAQARKNIERALSLILA